MTNQEILDENGFVIENLLGRPIFIRNLDPTYENVEHHCADCGNTASLVVYELNGDRWYWCGNICIGG